MSAQLRLTRVVKSYDGKTPIVKGVSLDAAAGEFLTILGPSGCGKSTLLRVIAGLERADEGGVEIGGVRVNDLEPRDRDIAMVFQSYALYPHMSVFDNIAVALKLRGASDIRPRVEEAARRLGIEKHLTRRPRELSGGERQRVALARALVRQPKLFLLDEPLSNLDALLRERARAELKSLFAQLKATVVYVTHDQVEAMTLSDRVAVMNAGVVEQMAPPQEVYARPATMFVAGFVGSPRMNMLPDNVGIRPEDVVVGDGPIAATLVLREPLGAHHLLTLRTEKFELRALVPADWSGGPEVRITLPEAKTHRFGPDDRRL